MPCLIAVFNGAATQSWSPDEDVQLTGYASYGSVTFTLSTDPQLSAANLVAAQAVTNNLIGVCRSGGAGFWGFTPLSTPAPRGESLYISADGGGFFVLFWDRLPIAT